MSACVLLIMNWFTHAIACDLQINVNLYDYSTFQYFPGQYIVISGQLISLGTIKHWLDSKWRGWQSTYRMCASVYWHAIQAGHCFSNGKGNNIMDHRISSSYFHPTWLFHSGKNIPFLVNYYPSFLLSLISFVFSWCLATKSRFNWESHEESSQIFYA